MVEYPPIPTTWEELVALRSYLDSCPGTYLRHPEDQKFYDLYQEHIPREIFLEIIKKQIQPNRRAILKNRFPYSNVLQNLPDVGHYILWNFDGQLNDGQIEEEVKIQFPDHQWFVVESAPNRKSVPEIWHTHIFVKGIPQYYP